MVEKEVREEEVVKEDVTFKPKYAIIDFETAYDENSKDPYFGIVTEMAIIRCNHDLEIVDEVVIDFTTIDTNKCKRERFAKELNKVAEEGYTVVFWHQWMFEYITKINAKYANKINLNGRMLILTQLYAFYDGMLFSRYGISFITSELTKRSHKGEALEDASDLLSCFKILREASMDYKENRI